MIHYLELLTLVLLLVYKCKMIPKILQSQVVKNHRLKMAVTEEVKEMELVVVEEAEAEAEAEEEAEAEAEAETEAETETETERQAD